MKQKDKILVTGHKGLVGSALVRRLKERGFEHVITWDHREVDLLDPVAVRWAFSAYSPDYVFMAAAKVGGVKAGLGKQAEFLLDNLTMQNNCLVNAEAYKVKKVCFLGSSCIYPEHAENPITEDKLLTGTLQPANEGYALAKICGLKLGQYMKRERGLNVVSAMPCNLFGPGDNFNEETAHVIPGMMARMHWAKVNEQPVFKVWGTKTAQREFLYSDDLADMLIFLMEHYDGDEPVNLGSDIELDMSQLAWRIAETVGYEGTLEFTGQNVGTSRKKMSVRKLHSLGWNARPTPFAIALDRTYASYLRLLSDPQTPSSRIGRHGGADACSRGLVVGPDSSSPGHSLS